MYNNKKVIVVLPAYNAALTMGKTIAEIPRDLVDEIVLVDDNSTDNSVEVARSLGIKHIIGYEDPDTKKKPIYEKKYYGKREQGFCYFLFYYVLSMRMATLFPGPCIHGVMYLVFFLSLTSINIRRRWTFFLSLLAGEW